MVEGFLSKDKEKYQKKEEKAKEIWTHLEQGARTKNGLVGIDLILLKSKMRPDPNETELVREVRKYKEVIEHFLDKWFPFSEDEVKRLGIKKKDIRSLLSFEISAKEKWQRILKLIKDERLKELLKDVADCAIDDVVILFLLLFVLEDLFASGSLSPEAINLIKNVLKLIKERCKCKIKARQKQIEFLHAVREQALRFSDFTSFNLKLLAASFISSLGDCNAS